jgi:hypothetical protein
MYVFCHVDSCLTCHLILSELFHHAAQLFVWGNRLVYKHSPTFEIHSFETFCLSCSLVKSESSCFTIILYFFSWRSTNIYVLCITYVVQKWLHVHMHNVFMLIYAQQICNVFRNKPYTLAGFEPGSPAPQADSKILAPHSHCNVSWPFWLNGNVHINVATNINYLV